MIGFDRFWTIFWVTAVRSGWILISVGADPDGFARFWNTFWVVAIRSGWVLIAVGAGLDGFDRFLTVSVCSEGRAPVFAPGNARSRRANPTHTQMKLEESKPRRILRSVFGCGWVGSHIHWSCLVWSVVVGEGKPPHTHSRSGWILISVGAGPDRF